MALIQMTFLALIQITSALLIKIEFSAFLLESEIFQFFASNFVLISIKDAKCCYKPVILRYKPLETI